MSLFDPDVARASVVAVQLADGRGSPSVTPRERELAAMLSLALVEIERLREIGEISARTMERLIARLRAAREERERHASG